MSIKNSKVGKILAAIFPIILIVILVIYTILIITAGDVDLFFFIICGIFLGIWTPFLVLRLILHYFDRKLRQGDRRLRIAICSLVSQLMSYIAFIFAVIVSIWLVIEFELYTWLIKEDVRITWY